MVLVKDYKTAKASETAKTNIKFCALKKDMNRKTWLF